jgi:hypothetical protein
MSYLFFLKSAERGRKYGYNTQQFLCYSSALASGCDTLAVWFKVNKLDILPRQFQTAFGINSENVSEDK